MGIGGMQREMQRQIWGNVQFNEKLEVYMDNRYQLVQGINVCIFCVGRFLVIISFNFFSIFVKWNFCYIDKEVLFNQQVVGFRFVFVVVIVRFLLFLGSRMIFFMLFYGMRGFQEVYQMRSFWIFKKQQDLDRQKVQEAFYQSRGVEEYSG